MRQNVIITRLRLHDQKKSVDHHLNNICRSRKQDFLFYVSSDLKYLFGWKISGSVLAKLSSRWWHLKILFDLVKAKVQQSKISQAIIPECSMCCCTVVSQQYEQQGADDTALD